METLRLDLGMETLRHSGYGFQIKSPNSRSSGIKGVVEHGKQARELLLLLLRLLAMWD